MSITSIQKVIKVGSSLAVTIPARDAKAQGLVSGSEVESTITVLKPAPDSKDTKKLAAEYEAFKAQYGETLKNLSQR